MHKLPLTVTIITLNEEDSLLATLNSVAFADEVVVVDSLSTDQTLEIAKKWGAKTYSQAFLGYGQQKNFAASKAQNDWILNVDADEVVSSEMQKAIRELFLHGLPAPQIYQFKRLNYFAGKPIYHGGWYPDYNRRLYNKQSAKWSEPAVHEEVQYIAKNPVLIPIKLEGHLHHFSFPSIAAQIATNLKYAQLGAEILLQKRKRPSWPTILVRPFIKFIECYIVKKGILDGAWGLVIALNAAYSIFLKYLFARYPQNKGTEKGQHHV